MRLRHRVQFNSKSHEKDDYGNVIGEFVPNCQVWGNIRETSAKERLAAGAVEGITTATIRVRHSSATIQITAGDQAVARGKTWNLEEPTLVGDSDAFIDIKATSGGAQ